VSCQSFLHLDNCCGGGQLASTAALMIVSTWVVIVVALQGCQENRDGVRRSVHRFGGARAVPVLHTAPRPMAEPTRV